VRGLPRRRSQVLRTVVVPAAAAVVALGSAIAGALITGTTTGGLTGGVEGVSSSASGTLGDISTLFPLGFAFGAGMVSAVNPCGFTMLPAYLGLYLGAKSQPTQESVAGRQLAQALLVGATVTAGFVALFAVVGLSVGAGAQFLVTSFPWIGLSIGVALIAGGAWTLSGGTLYSALGERLAARVGDPGESNMRGYFLFGVSYGTASLSCTLPIFLTVVGGSIAVGDILPSTGQFILYGLGMGSVIMALTLSIGVFKAALVGKLRRLLPYIQPVSAAMLLAAGGYIVYYWLTLGELLDTFV
jgi:cytochrome c biogenesis protein CcdA